VLDAFDPLAFVIAAVYPGHLAVTMPFIFKVLSLVDIATCPLVDAETVLVVLQVLSVIVVAIFICL
jgi:hypothetical protein